MATTLLKSYLIIAGTTKAGTGSLFKYISDHPEVCGSNTKETRFFFDQSIYPLDAFYSLDDGIEQYENFFSHCPEKRFRVEATPDYLYSPSTSKSISNLLQDVKLLFILRHPVDRLVSWYRFSKQQGLLNKNIGFDRYIEDQFKNIDQDSNSSNQQHLHALEQGRYSNYLQSYLERFHENQILILDYAELKNDPKSLLKRIAAFRGFSPDFYDSYDFQIVNPTRTMKNQTINRLYVRLRQLSRKYTHDKQWIHDSLHRLRVWFEPIYLFVNTASDEKVLISKIQKQKLAAYYANEPAQLAHLYKDTDFTYWQF
jgi:hypothetical protein